MSFFAKPQTSQLGTSVQAMGSLKVPGDLEIYGTLKGERIEAKGKAVIHAKADVAGALKAASLLVEPGAIFSGVATVGSIPSDILKRYANSQGLNK